MRIDLNKARRAGRIQALLTNRGDNLVRIWSGRCNAYWRAGGIGLSDRVATAGVFTLQEAVSLAEGLEADNIQLIEIGAVKRKCRQHAAGGNRFSDLPCQIDSGQICLPAV